MTTDQQDAAKRQYFESWRTIEAERVYPTVDDRLLLTSAILKYVFDDDEAPYLDFDAGYATLPLGHGNPYVRVAIEETTKTFARTGGWGTTVHGAQMEYLHHLAPLFKDGHRFLFTESENAAVRTAIRLVRRRTPGWPIMVLNRQHLPDGLHGVVTHPLFPTAETVWGERDKIAGFYVCPYDPDTFEVIDEKVLWAAVEVADKHDLPIVWDASVDSFGWNGDLFRVPDYATLTVLGGALGGGLPLGAVVGHPDHLGVIETGRAAAFSGNSMAFSAGASVLEQVRRKLNGGEQGYFSEKLDHELSQLCAQFPKAYTGTTGVGTIRGLRCASEQFAADLVREVRKAGIMLSRSGTVIRVVVPLVYLREDIEELAAVLLDATLKLKAGEGGQ